MSPEDEELTAFCTPKGIYCYKVMPFGLKNASATYKRAMQKIFGDMLHKNVECYVDDLVIKSKRREDHLKDLRMVFNRLRKYQLKMNPLKCAFGVTLAGRCQPFSLLMKKDVPFVWDEACHNAFESIKRYLSSSPLLGAPIPGKPLILYIAAQERSIGALLAQENESHKEQALYYLSQTLTGPELNYTPIEKTCLALVFAIQKLRHYMQAFTVHLIARADPVRYVMSKPVLTGRLAKWALLLNQYEIIYTPAKAVKGQAVADFLADHPIPTDWEISDDLPDEQVFFADVFAAWMMFFYGSARKDGAGAGVVFVSPEKHALIMGLQMAVEMKISSLEVYGDSMLVINQLLTHYEVRKDDLILYHQMATQLLERFDFVTLEHVPRKDNQMADALANLVATLALTKDEAATTYSLMYGVEAVLPLESQIPSLRMAVQEGLTDEENAKLCLQELEALDEKRLEAQQRLECYQARLSNAFNKKVRPRSFQVGDLVLALRRPIITTHKTGSKFTSKWDGPYVVQEVYTSSAYKIIAEDGLRIGPINGKFLKRYYA
ncbi:unnamed protein product [Prunus brigantina]